MIIAAAALGAVALCLLILMVRPYSRFEEEYPMTVASGSATNGGTDENSSQGPAGQNDSGTGESGPNSGTDTSSANPADSQTAPDATTESDSVTGIPLVHAQGGTLETRISPPEGFTRTTEEKNSLGTFLREMGMKKDGSPVLLYNKEQKENQNAHVAVFKLPLEREDLQQCADSVMRVYAEYFRSIDDTSRIQFSLTDDFKASYAKWREGYRIYENGNSFEWEDAAEFDGSESNFKKFMRLVFAYAGTYSLEADSKKVKLKDIRIGDIFIQGGSPGHVVMVVDLCENADGRKAFLLAQGYMPAQQFQLLRNPAHPDDPWYYVDEVSYPFETPEYTFEKECLRRPTY